MEKHGNLGIWLLLCRCGFGQVLRFPGDGAEAERAHLGNYGEGSREAASSPAPLRPDREGPACSPGSPGPLPRPVVPDAPAAPSLPGRLPGLRGRHRDDSALDHVTVLTGELGWIR